MEERGLGLERCFLLLTVSLQCVKIVFRIGVLKGSP